MDRQLSLPGFAAPHSAPVGPASQMLSLFLGILPEEGAARRIADLAARLRGRYRLRGRLISTERLHVSLYGLGQCPRVPPPLIALTERVVAAVRSAPFEIRLDRVMSFASRRPHRPLVLVGGDGGDGVRALHRAIGHAVKSFGLRPGGDAFEPHVTLLYDQHGIAEEAVQEISWTVRELSLVCSLVGRSRYVVLRRWPLEETRSR